MAVAIIVVEPGKSTFKIHGRPVSASDAVDLIADFLIDFFRPMHVVTNKQIEPAIIVVVDPAPAAAPVAGRAAYACFGRDLSTFAATYVAEQMVAPDGRPEHVGLAAVIVISIDH